MEIKNIFLLVAAAANFSLGVFIFSKGLRKAISLSYASVCFFVSFWALSVAMFRYTSDLILASWLMRFSYIAAAGIACSLFCFMLLFPVAEKLSLKEKFLIFIPTAAIFLFLLSPVFLVKEIVIQAWGKGVILGGWGKIFFTSYFVVFFLGAIFIAWYKYRYVVGMIRSQLTYILLGIVVPGTFGTYFNLVLPFASDHRLIWLGPLFPVLMVGFIAYAIVRHRLMDIRVVVKRSTLFSGLVAVVGLAYVLAAWAVGFLVVGGPSTLRAQVITGLIVAALTAVGFQPLYRWLQKTTDKFLFKNDYRPEELIGLISGQLATVLELKTIKEVLARELEGAMKVEKVEVGTLGINPPWPPFTKGGNNENNMAKEGKNSGERLADYFQRRRDIVVVDELKRRVQEGVDSEKEAGLIAAMGNSGLAVVAPLFAKEELVGVLGLGQKKSGDMFTTEDLRTLETISSQAAIAIENARLYEETKGFSVKLQGEVERQTVELKQANADLQKLDKAKSDFISIASHQLRTPLSVIKGGISIILEGGVFGSVAGITKEKLAEIYEYNERLIKLVNDLLDLSHMEGGKMKYEFKKVDLAEMTESVVKELSLQADKKKLKLSFVLPKEAIWVRADEGKLRQVVMNLIDNAIKYTDKGSVEVSLAKKDGAAQFAVRDTGMGMTKEELANLFQKFVRGANAPRYHTDGSGIGLYVAKKMIEEHGGQVWAESEGEGKGSTFFVKMGGWEIG